MSDGDNDVPAISLRGLYKDYGERRALQPMELAIKRGSSLLILGPNGSGKTTLLRILATLLRPSGGEIGVLGCALPGEAWRLRGRVGYLGHVPLLYRDLTGRENLRFHASLHGMPADDAEARIATVLEMIAMAERSDERVSSLSAGMRQRLAICRCALHEPELLLLDEPDSNLDVHSREMAAELVGRAPGRTRVIVSHDADRARPQADQVLTLGPGGYVESFE